MRSIIEKISKVLIGTLTFGIPLLVDVLAKKKTEQWMNNKTFVTYYEGDDKIYLSVTVKGIRKSFVLRIDQYLPRQDFKSSSTIIGESERSD